jgi:protein-tyrosine phosphatase
VGRTNRGGRCFLRGDGQCFGKTGELIFDCRASEWLVRRYHQPYAQFCRGYSQCQEAVLIDLHSHLLPGIDDGSQDWEESLEMARQALKSGTTEVLITHHILNNSEYQLEDEILGKFEKLQQLLRDAKLPLQLHLAAEIYYQPDMNLSHRISTFDNNGRYFLVEFPMQGIPRGVDEVFFDLIMNGKTPIIAHPERNFGLLKNPQRAYEFVQRGCLLQMNACSLEGKYGEGVKALAIAFMNSRLIHFIGSDGHNAQRRPMRIGQIYKTVCELWGEGLGRRIFSENARLALAGKDIKIPEPLPVEAVRKLSSFSPINLFRKLLAKSGV